MLDRDISIGEPTELIIGLALFALFMAIYGLSIWRASILARRRGRSRRKWTGLATVFGPLALLMLFVLPSRRRR